MSKRTEEILSKLSLDEKIFHLVQLTTATFVPSLNKPNVVTGPNSILKLDEDMIHEAGTLLNLIGAETMIEGHDYFMSKNKNGIPPIFMQDIIHGHRTLYPINLAVAASFNRELAKDLAAMAAKEASLDGVSVTFAPMVDLVRDPRWGRVM
ncbi:MAG: beta-glucosidase, partial [Clostridia bacterium]|nr:beta-glucosidase [Clostridia bacterium]